MVNSIQSLMLDFELAVRMNRNPIEQYTEPLHGEMQSLLVDDVHPPCHLIPLDLHNRSACNNHKRQKMKAVSVKSIDKVSQKNRLAWVSTRLVNILLLVVTTLTLS